jgi:integrase
MRQVTKIAPREESEAYKNFSVGIDSKAILKVYKYSLSRFMEFVGIEDYDELLTIDQPRIETIIRDFIFHCKTRKLSFNSISAHVCAVVQFYSINNIVLNTKRISKWKGKKRLVTEDKPYTREQIQRLLGFADLRMKCIILLMASAGLRRGALPYLKIGDLERVSKYSLYKIKVYRNETENYVSYCTPECAKVLDEYFKYRERLGETLNSKSPVLRQEFDSVDAARPKLLSTNSINWLIFTLATRSGIRERFRNRMQRAETMQNHGFRKFFMTTATNAGINPVYCEYLMGHKTGLIKSYFKPTDSELLEGNDKTVGYVGVINELTINEEFRLKEKVSELEAYKRNQKAAIRQILLEGASQLKNKEYARKLRELGENL